MTAGWLAASGQAGLLTHVLSKREIASALVTIKDVPAGYARTKLGNSFANDTTSPCPKAKDPFASATVAKDEVDFSRGALGPFIVEGVAQQRTGTAVQGMAAFRRLLFKCGTFKTTSSDGSTETGRFESVAFPRLGDDTIAVKVAIDSKTNGVSFHLSGAFAAVRSHDVLVLLAGFGLVKGPSIDTLANVARRAVANIQRAQR